MGSWNSKKQGKLSINEIWRVQFSQIEVEMGVVVGEISEADRQVEETLTRDFFYAPLISFFKITYFYLQNKNTIIILLKYI